MTVKELYDQLGRIIIENEGARHWVGTWDCVRRAADNGMPVYIAP